MDAVTGEPLENIWVTLRVSGGRFGAYPTVAEDSTDARGRFSLDDPVERRSNLLLWANDIADLDAGETDPAYAAFRETVESGRHHVVHIEMQPLDD